MQILRPAHLHAGRALDQRLDDDGRELVAVGCDEVARGVEAGGVGELRCTQDRESQRVEDARAEVAATEGERADGVAVIRTAEAEERGLALHALVDPVLEGDLQGLFNRARAVGRVEEVRLVDGHNLGQRLGELHHDGVAVAQHGGVRAALELRDERVVEFGDPMAERRHPERGDRIEVAAAFGVDDVAAVGAVHHDRRVLGVRVHLGEPVPHDVGVALRPLLVAHAADATTRPHAHDLANGISTRVRRPIGRYLGAQIRG